MYARDSPSALAAVNSASIHGAGNYSLDSVCFHYSIYRNLLRFLGLDGNLEVAYDIPADFARAWSEMVVRDDLFNAYNGTYDPRHMYGVGNQDVFRW